MLTEEVEQVMCTQFIKTIAVLFVPSWQYKGMVVCLICSDSNYETVGDNIIFISPIGQVMEYSTHV